MMCEDFQFGWTRELQTMDNIQTQHVLCKCFCILAFDFDGVWDVVQLFPDGMEISNG